MLYHINPIKHPRGVAFGRRGGGELFYFLPPFLLWVNSSRKEFAPPGANSFF